MKRIYFVRHGETEGNLGKYYQSSEVKLTEAGHTGAKAVAERVAHLPIDLIVASHFTRAQQTAKHIQERIDKPLKTVDAFHEVVNASSVWGKVIGSEETAAYAAERKERFTDPEWGPDEAENFFAVLERLKTVMAFLEEATEENIVVVSHGNFLRHLTAYLLTKKNPDPQDHMSVYTVLDRMTNVAITEFTYEDGEWRLFTWNDHAHFAE